MFLDGYVQYAGEPTDAPRVFHQFAAYSTLGSVVGRKAYLQWGVRRLYPNLYVLLAAPSTTFRKSTALAIAKKIVKAINPALLWPNNFSDESLIRLVAQRKNGIIFEDEFSRFLLHAEKEYAAGTKMEITELYDSPEFYPFPERMASRGDMAGLTIEYPAPSILAASTETALFDTIDPEDILTGFFARFMFVSAQSKEKRLVLPPREDDAKRYELVKFLSELIVFLSEAETEARPLLMLEDAKGEYGAWSTSWEANVVENPAYQSVEGNLGRLTTGCLKLAALNSLDRMDLQINEDDVKKAISMIEIAKNSVIEILADWEKNPGTFEGRVSKLKRSLRRYSRQDKVMSMQEAAGYFNSSKEIEEALDILCRRGVIRRTENGIRWIDQEEEKTIREAERFLLPAPPLPPQTTPRKIVTWLPEDEEEGQRRYL
jgi:hypothetical protein